MNIQDLPTGSFGYERSEEQHYHDSQQSAETRRFFSDELIIVSKKHGVIISASSNPLELWRYHRLIRLLDALNEMLWNSIHSLDDDKGYLTCVWKNEIVKHEAAQINYYWQIIGSEPEENVIHETLKGKTR